MDSYIDITPAPKILRVLGEIPFQPWQCIAELIDNSIDAFSDTGRSNIIITEKRISACWSSETVAAGDRSLEIIDTAPGMSFSQLQNVVRAGYSNNDPIHKLGLFGMGFNIATARLGEKTTILSTTKNDKEWFGIEIDFFEMIKAQKFNAPVIIKPKSSLDEHGTKVIVTKLKDGVFSHLRQNENAIRRQLENIYAPLLNKSEIEILIQGKKLFPKSHCVWSSTRYITRDGRNIPAVIEIDRNLGDTLFDTDRNRYLSSEEEAEWRFRMNLGETLPQFIVERRKRLTGWIGIQRFSDPNDFGLDFIRNGRKILISNKFLFNYENPLTGTTSLEYPIELGSTVGGRIVGELLVDYLLPTYQKNDFDRTDHSWSQTVEAIRGVGPILPKTRKAMQFSDDNTSPLGLLINAYRRANPGTKNLSIDRNKAREFYERFRKGEVGFQNDDKWWQAALEEDRLRATGGAETSPEVDSGSQPYRRP